MSLKINSNVGATLSRLQETTAPAAKQPVPAVPEQSTQALQQFADSYEQALSAQRDWVAKYGGGVQAPGVDAQAAVVLDSVKDLSNTINEQQNVVAGDQLQKGGWASDTPVLQQTEDANCGEAVVTMLKGAKQGKEQVAGAGSADTMNNLKSRFGSADGTRPDQMGDMLAAEKIEVKKSTSNFDKDALDGALRNGDKATLMVDSNKIAGGTSQPAGKSHWVLVDGMDDKGRYQVKDPGNGSSYYVKPEELANAIDTGRNTHQSGGMMIVGNSAAAATTSEQDLANKNKQSADVLGDGSGGGSNWRKFGRESD
ncbi:hypothetical protein [Vitiosangium sp. GDMCC 1.1324]|uniref:hypothetical protein n=1 Tax=Vitiosangium sp. (strain GDMCC 1.1324) TaxID=2138576 RepID=UPI000D338EE5|nr:hypothetical protein [Vitiosangium sp. GDMCC 1.1324]PTL84854.1 hypothetical protein DAT35_07305 [Vitiosangium sp. GDMCC 1.1324]